MTRARGIFKELLLPQELDTHTRGKGKKHEIKQSLNLP